MKKSYLSLFVVVYLWGCKKDALKVDEEKEYVQVRSAPALDLVSGGIDLTLKPNGFASICPGGDIVWSATYDISGKKITIKAKETNTTYRFTIISKDEIHGSNGEVLKIVKR